MCELCNISKPFPPSWHMLLTHMYLWTNHLCISLKHISPPKVVTQLPKPNKDLFTCSLLSPPSFTISYHITSIQCLNGPDNCPNLHVGFSLQYSHQPLGNEGKCQLSMPQCQHMVSIIVWPNNFCDLSLSGDLLLPCTNPPWVAFLVAHKCVTALRI